jgi:hypothetical protein
MYDGKGIRAKADETDSTKAYITNDGLPVEFATGVTLILTEITVFWDVTPCGVAGVYRRFGGTIIVVVRTRIHPLMTKTAGIVCN